MPQFDFATLFSVTASLTISCYMYYSFFSLNLLPEILILSKFRTKAASKASKLIVTEISLPNFLVYKKFFIKN